MKILWISALGGLYKKDELKGSGGWIGALQEALTERSSDIELGIIFPHLSDDKPMKENNVTYIPVKKNMGDSLIYKFFNYRFRDQRKYERSIVLKMLDAVKNFKPDIIHVWGIENFYAGILEYISEFPTVVHIQGLTSAYLYAYLPPRYNYNDILKSDLWFNRVFFNRGFWTGFKSFDHRAQEELRLSKYVTNWIGRTEWDRTMGEMLNSNASYYHCDEMMRNDFGDDRWHYHYDGETMHLQSAVSMEWYKGLDVVLKTAAILKRQGVNICWHIYGWSSESGILKRFIERTGIKPEDVGVVCHGNVDGKTIRNGLIKCDAYIHPSYIENSSNAIAEAQLMGVPVIAQNVGGNASMLKDDSGILVAPNEPYILAAKILSLQDRCVAEDFAQRAYDTAKARHDKHKIVNDLLNIYKEIIENYTH